MMLWWDSSMLICWGSVLARLHGRNKYRHILFQISLKWATSLCNRFVLKKILILSFFLLECSGPSRFSSQSSNRIYKDIDTFCGIDEQFWLCLNWWNFITFQCILKEIHNLSCILWHDLFRISPPFVSVINVCS